RASEVPRLHTRQMADAKTGVSGLFGNETISLEEGAVLLRGFVLTEEAALLAEVDRIAALAPFRHLVTPGGYLMSVAMTTCVRVGWVSDRSGYRYDPLDPDTGKAWPSL